MSKAIQLSPAVARAELRHLVDKALFAMWDMGASPLHKELGPQAESWKRLHDGLDEENKPVKTSLSPEQLSVVKTFLSLEDRKTLEYLLNGV